MPKAEKGSLKDLGKRIKAKGLQKLKFYCQMCEKQCRDANGFKCHLTSESHLRQMKIFSEKAGTYMDRYSKEFEKMYLDTLRMRHSTARVNANHVYQEVIQDKHHIHMNATIWASLSDFCKYLGKLGKCVVEETERGWYVTYIERDVGKLQQIEAQQKRQRAELEAECAAQTHLIQQRREAAKALDRVGGKIRTQATKIERMGSMENPMDKIHLTLEKTKEKKRIKRGIVKKVGSLFGDDSDTNSEPSNREQNVDENDPNREPEMKAMITHKRQKLIDHTISTQSSQPLSADEKGYNKNRQPSNVQTLTDQNSLDNKGDHKGDHPWLYRHILVRIVNKKLGGGKYYRQKATVDELYDDFVAKISVTGDDDVAGDILQIDQDDLETVAPKKVGEKVLIVRGKYRGEKAVAKGLDKKKYQATLELDNGRLLECVDFDDFSKIVPE